MGFDERYKRNCMTDEDYKRAAVEAEISANQVRERNMVDTPKRSAADALVDRTSELAALSERVMDLVVSKTSPYRLDVPKPDIGKLGNNAIGRPLPEFFERMESTLSAIERHLAVIKEVTQETEL